jgi:hypothetical protein
VGGGRHGGCRRGRGGAPPSRQQSSLHGRLLTARPASPRPPAPHPSDPRTPQPPPGSNTALFTLADDDDEPAATTTATPLLDAERAGGADGDASGAPGDVAASRGPAPGAAARAALDDYSPVPYNYSFFHLIFALASMYMAMLFTGWGTASEMEKDRIDIGWASVWIKTGAQWVMSLLYAWTLVAPAILPDRFS